VSVLFYFLTLTRYPRALDKGKVEGHSSLGSPHSPVQEASVRGALEVGVTRSRIRNPTSCCIGGEGEPPRAQEALAIPPIL
jgi:hypothetical protein